MMPHTPMPHTAVDLSPVYPDAVKHAERGIALLPDRRVIVQDEWTAGDRAVDVQWQMLTTASVDVHGNAVILTEAWKSMRLDVSSTAAPLEASVVEAETLMTPYDTPNPDTRLVRVRVRTLAGQSETLRVVFTPGSSGAVDVPKSAPLAEWSDLRRVEP